MRVLLFSYQVFGLINMCTTTKACTLLLISHLESNNRATFTQLKRYSINNLAVMTSIQLQNVKSELEKGRLIRAPICENQECEEKIKEETSADVRVITKDSSDTVSKCIKCSNQSVIRPLFARGY